MLRVVASQNWQLQHRHQHCSQHPLQLRPDVDPSPTRTYAGALAAARRSDAHSQSAQGRFPPDTNVRAINRGRVGRPKEAHPPPISHENDTSNACVYSCLVADSGENVHGTKRNGWERRQGECWRAVCRLASLCWSRQHTWHGCPHISGHLRRPQARYQSRGGRKYAARVGSYAATTPCPQPTQGHPWP